MIYDRIRRLYAECLRCSLSHVVKHLPESCTVLLLCVIASAASSCGQGIYRSINSQMKEYPESRIQDIYKSFCQDNLGPEHLIPNAEAARKYLSSELTVYRTDVDSGKYAVPARRFEAVGDKGNYIRVDLSVVLDSLISEEVLLDAFVRSANAGQNMTPEQWKHKWQKITTVIRNGFATIPECDKDLQRIDSLMAKGHYILHHSPAFNAAYHPHYRIILRSIFEETILPSL